MILPTTHTIPVDKAVFDKLMQDQYAFEDLNRNFICKLEYGYNFGPNIFFNSEVPVCTETYIKFVNHYLKRKYSSTTV